MRDSVAPHLCQLYIRRNALRLLRPTAPYGLRGKDSDSPRRLPPVGLRYSAAQKGSKVNGIARADAPEGSPLGGQRRYPPVCRFFARQRRAPFLILELHIRRNSLRYSALGFI